MPEPVELNLRPSGLNALSWSPDGVLCVAATTDLHLLFPRTRHSIQNTANPDPIRDDDDEWEHIYFEIASYPNSIWPLIIWPQGDARSFYLAREQRLSEVLAVRWSPAGLASHERCVLGVLTSNGMVSVVRPGAQERSVGGWKRGCVVSYLQLGVRTHGLTDDHNPRGEGDDEDDEDDGEEEEANDLGSGRDSSEHDEQKVNDKRVLALDGPIKGFQWAPGELNSKPRFRMMAVTETSLVVIRLTIEGDDMIPTTEAKLDLPEELPTLSLEEESQRHQHGCHLLWHLADTVEHEEASSHEAKEVTSYVLVAFHGKIRQIRMKHHRADIGQTLRLEWCEGSIRGFGPISISSNHLFYTLDDDIASIWYSPESFSRTQAVTTRPFNGWDSPASMLPLNNGVIITQRSSLLSHCHTSPSGLQLDYLLPSPSSRLSKQIASCRLDFSEEYEIGDAVTTNAHGGAMFKDSNSQTTWMAALVSFGPSNQIVYKMKHNERATLVFTTDECERKDVDSMEKDGEESGPQFPWRGEALPAAGPEVVHSNTSSLLPQLKLERSAETGKIALLHIFVLLLLEGPKKDLDNALEVLKRCDDGAWETAHAKTLGRSKSSPVDIKLVNGLIQQSAAHEQVSEIIESCTIPGCGSPILFAEGPHALTSAVCSGKGHPFARCSLTILAIQQPYVSKQCENCSRTFMDQDKINQDWQTARTVLGHFKRCPYCNGKFVS